jgi:hypothetical protein
MTRGLLAALLVVPLALTPVADTTVAARQATFAVTVGTTIEIPAGTYSLTEIFDLDTVGDGSGTDGAWKKYQPASGATVVIRGGGTWDKAYTWIDGSTGANSQLLIDGLLHPSYPSGSGLGNVTASHVRGSYLEYRGAHDFHYSYALDNVPDTQESYGYVNNGAALSVTGTDVWFKHCDFHGQYSFLGFATSGELTIESSFIRNVFQFGSPGGAATLTYIGNVMGPAPNHGANFEAVSGGYFRMHNNLYVLSQEGPVMNDSGTPGTLGVDTLILTHNTFWQPEVSWSIDRHQGVTDGTSSAVYGMDGIGLVGGSADDGVRVSGTIQNNVIKSGHAGNVKRILSPYTMQIGAILTATSVNYNFYISQHATPFRTFSSYPLGGQSTKTFAQWRTDTGLDANSLFSSAPGTDLDFVNAAVFTDPQPNPGSAANFWGFPIFDVSGSTIAERVAAVRANHVLASTSVGYNAASDGRSMGIYDVSAVWHSRRFRFRRPE